jgi:hypothetical protein
MTTAVADMLPRPSRDPARMRADLERHGYCIVERALEGQRPKDRPVPHGTKPSPLL